MRIVTPQVTDYLIASRQRFASMLLPDATPIDRAMAFANRNQDIHGLEALAKLCGEAKEMATLRSQAGLADLFENYATQALQARASILIH